MFRIMASKGAKDLLMVVLLSVVAARRVVGTPQPWALLNSGYPGRSPPAPHLGRSYHTARGGDSHYYPNPQRRIQQQPTQAYDPFSIFEPFRSFFSDYFVTSEPVQQPNVPRQTYPKVRRNDGYRRFDSRDRAAPLRRPHPDAYLPVGDEFGPSRSYLSDSLERTHRTRDPSRREFDEHHDNPDTNTFTSSHVSSYKQRTRAPTRQSSRNRKKTFEKEDFYSNHQVDEPSYNYINRRESSSLAENHVYDGSLRYISNPNQGVIKSGENYGSNGHDTEDTNRLQSRHQANNHKLHSNNREMVPSSGPVYEDSTHPRFSEKKNYGIISQQKIGLPKYEIVYERGPAPAEDPRLKSSQFKEDYPLRDDLYIGQDGNIYLKDEGNSQAPKDVSSYQTDLILGTTLQAMSNRVGHASADRVTKYSDRNFGTTSSSSKTVKEHSTKVPRISTAVKDVANDESFDDFPLVKITSYKRPATTRKPSPVMSKIAAKLKRKSKTKETYNHHKFKD